MIFPTTIAPSPDKMLNSVHQFSPLQAVSPNDCTAESDSTLRSSLVACQMNKVELLQTEHKSSLEEMLRQRERRPTNADFRFTNLAVASSPLMDLGSFGTARNCEPMLTDENTAHLTSGKRKKGVSSAPMDECEAPPAPPTKAPTGSSALSIAAPASTNAASGGGAVGANSPVGESRSNSCANPPSSKGAVAAHRDLELSISCLEGSTMRIPLKGKTISFKVMKKRGRGISSVVFECEREPDTAGQETDVPATVTVKVMSGGEMGMKTCLREVETLAFLKVKGEQAGLQTMPIAELTSWFYRRSSLGGVDHVCLVFRGGGLSLREAMLERPSALAKTTAGIKFGGFAWTGRELAALARGLLEGIRFLHSVGLVHADLKPENVVLYFLDPEASGSAADKRASGRSGRAGCSFPPLEVRLIDFGNAVFATDTIAGVPAGAPSYLSPEVQQGLPWGTPTDVWATGCILHEVITGERFKWPTGSSNCGGNALPPEGESMTDVALHGVAACTRRLLRSVDSRPSAAEALASGLI